LTRATFWIGFAVMIDGLSLVGCAGPALLLYTLAGPEDGVAPALGARPTVILVERVTLPDELDSEDILVRDGSVFRRSAKGRWASRLSLQITGLLTRQLAARRPDALVTQQALAGEPSYRLRVTISQLDVRADGSAELAADWAIIPGNPSLPVMMDRATVSLRGSVATDADVVALDQAVIGRLAQAIDLQK